MKILVTGSKGFIGKNLILALKNQGYNDILEYDIDTGLDNLNDYCLCSDFVFHLAGINRPLDISEYRAGNAGFTGTLLDLLKQNPKKPPVMLSSSTQAELDNPYGHSKRDAEELVFAYASGTGAKAYVYRFPNVFGKWCRPNYNSAVATFCHNIANDLPIQINDREADLTLVYIDDLVDELINALKGDANRSGQYCNVPVTYTKKLGYIADTIKSFALCSQDLSVPDQSDGFIKKLYAAYISYLPASKFAYPLLMHSDNRGSFTEFIKTPDRGQVSVNISKPGIVKGNHWHNTKHEKFLVVSGSGVIRFRMPDAADIIEINVSGDKLDVVSIPPGYTHNIENTGDTDMVTIMWVNEPFDPGNPDTFPLDV